MSIQLDELAGPADADNFRMTVDYGRWYIDPLPGCDIAPATEDRWPSFTGVKKAADKDWSFLPPIRFSKLPSDELHRIADLPQIKRLDAFRSHEKFDKQISFGRGTIIHLWNEDLGAGREPREITDTWLAANKYPAEARDEALRYKAAIVDFWHTYQPELVHSEYVAIHRSLHDVGYGCTPDAILRIDGALKAVDYKTRSDGSDHCAYGEEAAQIAAGMFAEYMVVGSGDSARRQPLPEVDGGLVISIKTDGARLYPIDLDKAWEHFTHLHQWYCRKQEEKASIGRVQPKRSAPKVENPRDALLARYRALPDVDQERFQQLNIPKDDLAAIAAALDELENQPTMLERARERMASEPAKPAAVVDDEGGEADVDEELRVLAEWMTPEQRAWVGSITSAPISTGTPIRYTYRKVRRRADVCLTLAKWAVSSYWDAGSDEALRAAIYVVLGDDQIFGAAMSLGDALAQFTTKDASEFKDLVDGITADQFALIALDEGGYRWTPVAA